MEAPPPLVLVHLARSYCTNYMKEVAIARSFHISHQSKYASRMDDIQSHLELYRNTEPPSDFNKTPIIQLHPDIYKAILPSLHHLLD